MSTPGSPPATTRNPRPERLLLEERRLRALRRRLRELSRGETPATGSPDSAPALLPPRRSRRRERYYDTHDHRLARAEVLLVIRPQGSRSRAYLIPSAVAIPSPRERSQPIGAPEPSELARRRGPVAEALRLLGVSPADLSLTIDLQVRFERFPVLSDGREVGGVTLEQVEWSHAAGEVERRAFVVLEGTEPEAADAWRAWIGEALPPGPAARGEGEGVAAETADPPLAWVDREALLGPPWNARLGPSLVAREMNAAEAAFAVLRKQASSFLRHEPGTRLGDDPEHLHDMRVASRRMRAALRIFRTALADPQSALLGEELRHCARTLGAVRDLDVQIALLQRWAAEFVTVPPAAADPILERLARRREARRGELLELLDSRRFRLLRARLIRGLRRGPAPAAEGSEPAPQAAEPIATAAAGWVRRCRRRVLRAGDSLAPDSPPAEYHELRIRAKRLRYALEFTLPLYGEPSRRLIESLVAVQDLLGEHQDIQVARELLAEIKGEGPRLPEATLQALGELGQLLCARAEGLRGELPKALRRLRGGRWRKWKRTAAHLQAADPSPPPPGGAPEVPTWN